MKRLIEANREELEHIILNHRDETERLRKALAVFADPQSWDEEQSDERGVFWVWDKMGDYSDPQEFARLALEGK